MPNWLSSLTLVPSLLLAALACGGSDLTLPEEPGVPAVITVVKGNGQEAPVGTPLRDSIVVKVTDTEGMPVPNQQVVFVLADATPGAEVTPDAAMTGPDGMAAARWILGETGGTQQVVARVVSEGAPAALEARFTASAVAPLPGADRLQVRQQPSGSATAGQELERQPVVQVQDAAGNDIARSGVPVTAAVASGNGTLLGTTTRLTDVDGRAQFTNLIINGPGGAHVLIFAANGYASVTSSTIDVQDAGGGGGGGGGPPPPPPPPGGGGGGGGGNQPPTAGNDEYNTIEGANHTLTVSAADGVLRNDQDPESGQLTASDATDPPNGTVRLERDGSFSYTPRADFFGDDQFSYRASDPSGNSNTATVIIHVAPVNDPPWFAITDDQITVSDGAGPQTVRDFVRGITTGADNEPDQTVEFVVVRNSRPDLFAVQPAVSRDGARSDTGTLTFTPAQGQEGSADVTLVLRDNGGTANGGKDTSPERTFRIRVR